jgi:outer membrane lipoprotein-sorting protein
LEFGVWSFLFLSLLLTAPPAHAGESTPALTAWLAAQTNLQTWSADVMQTRTLKTLTQPLTAQGRVWFAAPNRFRWELTSPSPTIAVRQPDQMLVIYPRLKRAERYPLNGEQAGPWKDALALLEAGFPRSRAEIETRFNIVSQSISNATLDVVLQPKSPSARRLMPQIRISVATNDFALRATELQFADGSTMRNDFSNPKLNPKLEDELFTPKLEGDFKIVEPVKAGR